MITVNPNFYLFHNISQMKRYSYEVEIINKKLLNNFYTNDIPDNTIELDNLLDLFPQDIMSSDIDISDISDLL